MAKKIEKDAYGCKNRSVLDRAQKFVQRHCGLLLPSLLTFPDSDPFVCTYLSWAAAGNLPTYCLLRHCQKVQSVSSQARTLRLC